MAFGLYAQPSTETLESSADADSAPDHAVVLEEGRVTGFFDVDAFDTVPQPRTTRTQPTWTPSAASKPFTAFPALDVDVPEPILPRVQFDVSVGFRSDPEPQLAGSGSIVVGDSHPGESCLVVLISDGIEVDRDFDYLPLEPNARVRFTCKARPAVRGASLRAQYFFRSQLIGTAKRTIKVTGDGSHGADVPRPQRANPCRIVLPDVDRCVDLTVTITYSEEGTLQWLFSAPHNRDRRWPDSTSHPPARQAWCQAGGLARRAGST